MHVIVVVVWLLISLYGWLVWLLAFAGYDVLRWNVFIAVGLWLLTCRLLVVWCCLVFWVWICGLLIVCYLILFVVCVCFVCVYGFVFWLLVSDCLLLGLICKCFVVGVLWLLVIWLFVWLACCLVFGFSLAALDLFCRLIVCCDFDCVCLFYLTVCCSGFTCDCGWFASVEHGFCGYCF